MIEKYDVVIVGSGPAGISAACHAASLSMSHMLVEKTDHLSDTIFKYQKGKHVMATPEVLPLRSDIAFAAGKREMVLDAWGEAVEKMSAQVRFGFDVTEITGQKDDFLVTAANGDAVRCRNIVLALGNQGNPNLIGFPDDGSVIVEYQLDDPLEILDEKVVVLGGGDAAIENAMGLGQDPDQGNEVTIVQRRAEFARAKKANVDGLMAAASNELLCIMTEAAPQEIKGGIVRIEGRDGELNVPADRLIARLGSAPPRKLLESFGIEFTGQEKEALPKISARFESSIAGMYVVGAIAGYPLIKNCINQGFDAIEYINGNLDLASVDEPLLAAKFEFLPVQHTVEEWLALIPKAIDLLSPLSPLQLRDFLLETSMRHAKAGEVIFEKGAAGSSVFAVFAGGIKILIETGEDLLEIPMGAGQMFGEVGLISGRPRGSTVVSSESTILLEIPRTALLKLMLSQERIKNYVDDLVATRMFSQVFGPSLSDESKKMILAASELITVPPNQYLITEGDTKSDAYLIRSGSMVVERELMGSTVFVTYLQAGAVVGEMAALMDGSRNASVKATVKSEVLKIPKEALIAALASSDDVRALVESRMESRIQVNDFITSNKTQFSSAVEMNSAIAGFVFENGLGEATDVLVINENLCIGCDYCEIACAESHNGITLLNREAGTTFEKLHIPTSCRHCEQPQCMTECPPNAITRSVDGEVFIADTCIGCGNCERNCPYDVIKMERVPEPRSNFLSSVLFGLGPGIGHRDRRAVKVETSSPKLARKCDMCKGIDGGPACVRACPTGAAARVSVNEFINFNEL
jgi:Fe-S-cluster-containing hydrogenase component 2/thioredoxin reductase/CRP-like cAMP-binding protein